MADDGEIKRVERMHAERRPSSSISDDWLRIGQSSSTSSTIASGDLLRSRRRLRVHTLKSFNVNNRLLALIALMRLRGFPEQPFIKEMMRFIEKGARTR